MRRSFGVVGTDTGAGKTVASCVLLEHFNRLGLRTLGIKPLSTGIPPDQPLLQDSDAGWLKQFSGIITTDQVYAPVRLERPVSPHLAVARPNQLQAERIAGLVRGAQGMGADITVIEGTGGWYCPINPRQTMADVFVQLAVPVILVVPVKLGCFNHALLTQAAISRTPVKIAGWIATFPQAVPEEEGGEMVDGLQNFIEAPLLGQIPHLSGLPAAAAMQHVALDLSCLHL